MERYELKEMWGKSPSAETHFTLCVIGWKKAILYSKWNPHAWWTDVGLHSSLREAELKTKWPVIKVRRNGPIEG
jgi:hypothetical protein